MNSISTHTPRWARFLLPLLWAAMLTGCMNDYADDVPDPSAPATLQLQLVAEQEGDLNETRATNEAGTDGEYMSKEICVLIVDGSGTVVRKFLPTDELQANTDAQRGNLRDWTSERFELAPGTYQIYAFANWSTAGNTALNGFVGIEEGADLNSLAAEDPAIDIDNIVLDDPAAQLDFDNANVEFRRFIPMSAKQEVTVTSATRSIDIGLDRLVSKVRISINPANLDGAALQSLTFSGVGDQVGLFKGQTVAANRDKTYTVDLTSLQTGTDGSYHVPDFYVNATEDGTQTFAVQLATSQYQGTVYEARTARTDLPRNSIYPLNLSFNDYVPQLDLQAWLSPIGTYPVPVEVAWDGTYVVDLPEGCQFSFSADGLESTAGVTGVTCQWTIPEASQRYAAFETADNGTTVKGHLTASSGLEFPLELYITWNEGGKPYARNYIITVRTTALADAVFASSTRVGVMQQLFPESVQILIPR